MRFCLPCSENSGTLVERTCPALDRKRAEKQARATARVQRSREIARSQREKERAKKRAAEMAEKIARASYSNVCGIDWNRLVRAVLRMWPSKTWPTGMPHVVVRPLPPRSKHMFNRVIRCTLTRVGYDVGRERRRIVEITLTPDATTHQIMRRVVHNVLCWNDAPEHRRSDDAERRRITTYTIEKLGSAFEAPNVYAIAWAMAEGISQWGKQSTGEALEQWLSTLTPEHRESTLVQIDQQLSKLE